LLHVDIWVYLKEILLHMEKKSLFFMGMEGTIQGNYESIMGDGRSLSKEIKRNTTKLTAKNYAQAQGK